MDAKEKKACLNRQHLFYFPDLNSENNMMKSTPFWPICCCATFYTSPLQQISTEVRILPLNDFAERQLLKRTVMYVL